MNDEHDDLFESLRDVSPGPFETDVFREDVFERTEGVLRRRRALGSARRGALVLVIAAGAFFAGRSTVATTASPQPEGERPPVEAAAGESEASGSENHPASPEEWKTAGDRLLAEEGDVEGAVRCYGEFLATAGSDSMAVDVDDSWLLTSLKLDLE